MSETATSEAPMKPLPRPNEETRAFWEACDRGELLFQECAACGHRQFYPRRLCQACHAADPAWKQASGRGRVYTFTVVNRAPLPAFKADSPYVLALIDLEEGPRMMMNVINCDPDAVHIDMPVRVTFERRGAGDQAQAIPQAEPA